MIRITCNTESYTYDMYHITKAFFPDEEITQKVMPEQKSLVYLSSESGLCFSVEPSEVEETWEKRRKKSYINKKLYRFLAEAGKKELAWGILTGIRPTKILMKQLETEKSEEEIIQWFRREYLVSGKKAKLGISIAKKEKELLNKLDYRNGYSLYVGIPFCPSRCSYCSFTSQSIELWKDRVDDYLEALFKELIFIGRRAKEQQKKLNTIYVGGGTPTTLSASQLERLLTLLETEFSNEYLKEMTVEAGRPDSITREKLEVLKAHNIGRISINPQTMQQKTLDLIGRKHTVEEVIHVYEEARRLGFSNINMDLIAGLPGETAEDMEDTLKKIEALSPDSLTVHALAMKRASKMAEEKKKIGQGEELSKMIEMASVYAEKMELEPYYMYRQKNIAGNFENVGYAKVDKAGIYNILIMEEKQSIIAAGAGATTKIVMPENKEKSIIRTENVKDVQEYISRIDGMIERKGEVLWR